MPENVQWVRPKALGGIVRFAVEIALGVRDDTEGTAIWQPDPDGALWDTKGLWSGLVPSWVDITPRVLELETNRGRDRWEQQFRVGRCSVLADNQDGVFNVDTPIGVLELRPGRWLRVLGQRTDDGSPWVPLWTGQIDAFQDQYAESATGINSRIISLDFGARFQIDDPPALETPIPAGQVTSDRVSLLLDEAGWPDEAFWRDIDTGGNTMAESTLPQSRWAEMQNAATAEGGAMFISGSGLPTFRNKDWLDDKIAGPVKFTVGQVASNVQILRAVTDWSQQRVYNDVRLARKDGGEIRLTDDDSRALYGPRTYARNDIQCQTDGQLDEIAARILGANRFDRARLEELELVPTSPQGVTDLLGLDLGDKLQVEIRTLGEGQWSYAAEYLVNKIDHVVTASDWTTTIRVDLADFTSPLLPAAFTTAFTEEFDAEDV